MEIYSVHFSYFIRNGAISKEKEPQSSSSTNANDESSSRPTTVRHVGGCCQWISSSSNDPIPQDAVEGGFEHGTLLYVSRSPYNGGIFPGKLNAQSRKHFFPLGTEGRTSDDYEVSLIIHSNNSSLVCETLSGDLFQFPELLENSQTDALSSVL